MNYHVEFTSAEARQVKKLPRQVQNKVLNVIATLAEDPRPRGSRKLTGEEVAWRIRVRDYRVIYEINDSVLVVTVVRTAHRREVYDH